MKVDDLIELLEKENGYDEVYVEIVEQAHSSAKVKTYRYDIESIGSDKHMVLLKADFFMEKERSLR